MKLIFLGAPGVGKGTQADLVSKQKKIPHISTGDIFRSNIKNATPLGKKAKEFMDKGYLVPDDVTNNMVKDTLTDMKSGYILDGYPRTIAQADFLSKIEKIDKVINFTLPESEIVKRISGRRTCKGCQSIYHTIWNPPKKEGVCDKCNGELIQRTDELPATVKKRLDVYNKETAPLIDYFKKKKLLAEIDASPKIEEITKALLKIL
ncbi:MAG: adenylate kinase [archaeon]